MSRDLRNATVYYGAFGRDVEEVEAALRDAAPHLRATLGRQVRLKYLPALTFRDDPALVAGQRVEEILRDIKKAPKQR